jgi:hypothetical protein
MNLHGWVWAPAGCVDGVRSWEAAQVRVAMGTTVTMGGFGEGSSGSGSYLASPNMIVRALHRHNGEIRGGWVGGGGAKGGGSQRQGEYSQETEGDSLLGHH